MSYIIFDAVIVAVLAFSIWKGYRKGFILTLCGFLAVFVAFIGATFVSSTLAQPVSDLMRPSIEQHLVQAIQQSAKDEGFTLDDDAQQPDRSDPSDSSGENDENTTPIPLQELLHLLQDNDLYKLFSSAIEDAVSKGVLTVSSSAAQAVSGYIALQIAKTILFFISFVLLLVVWFLISHALDLAFRLPVLSTLNHWSGAAIGLFKGGLLVFVAIWLLKGSVIPQEAMDGSILLHYFATVNPLAELSKLVHIEPI